ncbi:MAG TPA: SDR family oxidoreductase [Mycobacterium sp.]|nr:SDR family oxidoreductase [Mycobacterium sp.]
MTTTVLLGAADGIGPALADGIAASRRDADSEIPAGTTGVVLVVGADPVPEQVAVTETSDAQWLKAVSGTVWRTLAALQRAYAAMTSGGRVVVVVPTIGMAGAAGLVPYTTAVEGIRAMTKSAARQWRSAGIGVAMVAAPLHIFAPDLEALTTHLTAAAVTDDDTLVRSVSEAVTFLLRADVEHLAGATIVVDGGSVMLP